MKFYAFKSLLSRSLVPLLNISPPTDNNYLLRLLPCNGPSLLFRFLQFLQEFMREVSTLEPLIRFVAQKSS